MTVNTALKDSSIESYGSVDRPDKDWEDPLKNKDPEKSAEPLSTLGQLLNLPRSCGMWFVGLERNFGMELLLAIFAAEHLIKGFDHGVGSDATSFLFKLYHVEAVNVQTYTAVKAMPWSLKPAIGALSDLFPILGYRKAPYIIMSSIIGIGCYIAIGVDFSTSIPIEFCVIMLMGCNVQGSVCDLLTEAQYSERLSEKPKHGPDLVSFVWLGQTLMSLVASLIIGPLLSIGGPHLVFLICVVPAAVVLWPMSRNYLGERYQTAKESAEMRAWFLSVWEVFVPVIAVLVGAIALTICGLTIHNKLVRLIIALLCLALVLASINVALRPEISRIISFYIVQSAVHVSFSGASFYFYTDTEDELPGGPHFSKTFFTTVLGIVSAVCSLIGLWMYIKWFKHWGYRKILYVTNVVLCIAYLLDIVQFTRLNKRIGVNDHIFCLGSHTVQRLVARIAWMPQVLVLSQMCPKGLEGTMYAILAGSANFGGSIASFIGAYLLHISGVNPRGTLGDAAQLSFLWLPCVVSAIMPALMVLLIPYMIPDIAQTGAVLVEDPSSPSLGSPLSRWLAHRRGATAWSRPIDTNSG
uniref:Folate/biopterin transporter n=1 Tax=Alexandrium catenella TaxID=2925 RepID=A0A7S1PNK9_ALECA|mmetsp:Transcript_105123/g.279755  ORF Transcript_105123/g.279755 Transcript_105123/m.279755 type:complete len:581 (+) Transcript_105123:82-1824(+)